MTYGPDDHLYAASTGASVLRFNGATGELIGEFVPAGAGGLVFPLVVVFRGDEMFVGDLGTRAIHRFDARTGRFLGTSRARRGTGSSGTTAGPVRSSTSS
jgi:hypothetical protein